MANEEKSSMKNEWDLERLKADAKCFVYAKVGSHIHSIYVATEDTDLEDIYVDAQTLTPKIDTILIVSPDTKNWEFVEKHYDDDLKEGIFEDTPEEQQRGFKAGAIIVRLPEDYLIKPALIEPKV